MTDPIKPNHYLHGKYDVITHLKDLIGIDKTRGFIVGNIIKYVVRYQDKNGVQDLQKAKEYIKRLIELENGDKDE